MSRYTNCHVRIYLNNEFTLLMYNADIYRPVARGGSGGSIEPPISGSVYCAVQSVHSMPHGFGRRQSSRIHNIEQCSAARLAAPRLHKRARRSERADVYNNNN